MKWVMQNKGGSFYAIDTADWSFKSVRKGPSLLSFLSCDWQKQAPEEVEYWFKSGSKRVCPYEFME